MHVGKHGRRLLLGAGLPGGRGLILLGGRRRRRLLLSSDDPVTGATHGSFGAGDGLGGRSLTRVELRRRRLHRLIPAVSVVQVRPAPRLLGRVVLIGGRASVEAGREELTNVLG